MCRQRESLTATGDIRLNASFQGKSCYLVTIVWTVEYDYLGLNPSFAAALGWLFGEGRTVSENSFILSVTSCAPAGTAGGDQHSV